MSPRKPDPSSDEPSGLSLTQIAASAAAASSAAFAASYLGVAGTIIGAAVASVIATVATSMYSASLHRSREAVRRTAGQFGATWVVSAPSGATGPTPDPGRTPASETRVLEPVVEIAPEPPREPAGLRWGRVLPAAAAVLALTLGTLTGVEVVFGQPLSALWDGSGTGGTSLSTVTGNGTDDRADRDPDRAPAEPEGPAPGAEPTPGPEPTETPVAEPTEEPTAGPTEEPTGEPTPPATPTPTPTPTPDQTQAPGAG